MACLPFLVPTNGPSSTPEAWRWFRVFVCEAVEDQLPSDAPNGSIGVKCGETGGRFYEGEAVTWMQWIYVAFVVYALAFAFLLWFDRRITRKYWEYEAEKAEEERPKEVRCNLCNEETYPFEEHVCAVTQCQVSTTWKRHRIWCHQPLPCRFHKDSPTA